MTAFLPKLEYPWWICQRNKRPGIDDWSGLTAPNSSEQDGDEPAIVVVLSVYHAIHLPAFFCFWIFWLTIWKMMERSDKSTVRDAHSSALEASLNSDVHRRSCVWRPARQAIQFLDPESCHGPHFNVIHVHFTWDYIRWSTQLLGPLCLEGRRIDLASERLLVANLTTRKGSLSGLRLLRPAAPHQLLPRLVQPFRDVVGWATSCHGSIFQLAWWPSGNQLHDLLEKISQK